MSNDDRPSARRAPPPLARATPARTARRALTTVAWGVGAAACATDPVVPGPAEQPATLVFSSGPVRSPSGEWPSRIVRMSAAGGEPALFVAAEGRDVAPLPSPDGRWVAFSRGACCVGGNSQVVMIAPAAGGAARVLVPSRAFPLAWSHDGRWLYVDATLGAEGPAIHRVDPASGGRERVAALPYEGAFFSPAPDGRRFVMSTGDYHVALTLHVGELGGAAPTPLAPGLAPLLHNPQWSPDGARIAFLARGGADVAGLYTIRPDGTGLRRLVPGNGVSTMRWAPDGRSLVLAMWDTTQGAPGQEDLFRIAADGAGLANLTRSPERESVPAWSPDGRWIVFLVEDAMQQRDLFRMNADGTQRVRLTHSPELGEGPPAWLPPAP
jgi:Tol biopolymer transport system component